MSSSIGLGHAARDLAIAGELRRLRPDLEIEWLAGDPASRMIEEAGETLLPASVAFRETGFAEASAGAFSLNIVWYVAHALPAWVRAARAVLDAVDRRGYDLVVADEAYELAVAFRLRPGLMKVPYTIIYDFLGLDGMTRNPLERLLVHALNRLWGGGRHGNPPPFDLALFVGEPADVPDRSFGFRLPNRRAYASRHFHFLGYVLDFDPAAYAHRARVRARLGYDERPLIVCSIGGTAVGSDLLRLCAAAYPHLRERLPEVRMLIVCGPRIDPAGIQAPAGVEVRGYLPRLYEHFAACDVAVVQAGGTTTLELTALRRPFLYFPLEGHLEQNLAVAARLTRHHAGEQHSYSTTTPTSLADAIITQFGREPSWPPIPTDGAKRAAELIATRAPAAANLDREHGRPPESWFDTDTTCYWQNRRPQLSIRVPNET